MESDRFNAVHSLTRDCFPDPDIDPAGVEVALPGQRKW
jgi:hypothetical protein